MTAKSARRLDDAVLLQHRVECHGDEDGPVARHKQLAPQGKTMKNKIKYRQGSSTDRAVPVLAQAKETLNLALQTVPGNQKKRGLSLPLSH